MMKQLMDMLSKNSEGSDDGEEMDETSIKAKIEVLKELLEMAHGQSGENVADGMSKLTVMAPDKEGLMEGMEKAEEVVEDSDEMVEEHMMEDGSMMADEDMEDDEDEDNMFKKKKNKYRDDSGDY